MFFNRRRFLQLLASLTILPVFQPVSAAFNELRHRRAIPSSGELIPQIGMGSWLTFAIDPNNADDLQQRENVLREFLRLGGGMIDSSPMYGEAQNVIGQCLQRIGHHQGLFAATKVWTHGQRQGLLQMEESRLLWGLPRLDLMQVHNLMDWEAHLSRLYDMKQKGEIRYVGVTTSHGRRHEELIKIMKTRKLDFVQFTYNILDREAEQYLLPLARDNHIAVIINRPFQRGGLFDYVAKHRLPAWAAEIDCENWAQFFLKFIISHPAVTCAIPATSRVGHLQQNMAAAYGRLPDEEFRKKMSLHIHSL